MRNFFCFFFTAIRCHRYYYCKLFSLLAGGHRERAKINNNKCKKNSRARKRPNNNNNNKINCEESISNVFTLSQIEKLFNNICCPISEYANLLGVLDAKPDLNFRQKVLPRTLSRFA